MPVLRRDGKDGSLFFRRTHVPEMLRSGRCGVDVVMNGRFFLWDNVRKDRARGRFEPT